MNMPKLPEPDAQNKFFKAYRLMEGVTRITGLGFENCYLVEGTDRALLIDGLTGVGSLAAFVRELTDLPVSLALTHGHIDHAGMAWETGECYIHPDDIALVYTRGDPAERLAFVNGTRNGGAPRHAFLSLADVPADRPLKTYPIYEGDVFDLGGTRIEVISVPGHTCGTVVFLDRARRILFSGDACNTNTLVNLAGSTTIEEYLESLRHFKTYRSDFDVMYGGHGFGAVPNSIIDDGIQLCEDILAGRDDAIETANIGGAAWLALERDQNFAPRRGLCNIVYRKDMLHKRPHPVITDAPNLYK